MTREYPPPQSAAEASQQSRDLRWENQTALGRRKQRETVAAELKRLHRRERAKARAVYADESSQDKREDRIYLHPLSEEVRGEAFEVLHEAGFADPPDTVGDLEYLRQLAEDAASRARAGVDEVQQTRSEWQSVLGAARDERRMDATEGQ